MEPQLQRHRTLHWFRKGLRIHDNEALQHAIRTSEVLYCVYILDMDWVRKNERIGANRMRFILETLKDLDQTLCQMGTRLFVLQGDSKTVVKKFCKDHEITQMTWMTDAEVFYRQLDKDISTEVARREVVTKPFNGQTLYKLEDINEANDGKIPLSKHEFDAAIKKLGCPPAPVPAPTKEEMKECQCEIVQNHAELYGIPSLQALGFEEDKEYLSQWPGGETQALERMHAKFSEQNLFKRRNNNAGQQTASSSRQVHNTDLEPETTGLSAYLNFGALSVRTLWHSAATLSADHEQAMVTVHGQLLYREFFYCAASQVNNFTRIEGNRICRKIHWRQGDEAEKMCEAFREGRTGFPWIDAAVRKMRQDGWIHHLCRMSLATFLTIGHMWCSWEVGQQIFEEFLIDADYALNAGNFMWATGSAFTDSAISTRTLDPIKTGRFWDPQGQFIRTYLPELRNMPLQYLFSPWLAPPDIQEIANCRIGTDYPSPILNHKEARVENIKHIEQLNASFSDLNL